MPLSEEWDSTTATFESTSPATGAVVGVFPVHDTEAVTETVARARSAAERWAALGFAERKRRPARTGCASSPAPRRSPASASRCRWT